MQIIDFTAQHIEQAIRIAKRNYETERERVPALPVADEWPDMTGLVQNDLGVAAFDGGEMTGFLCCVQPFNNAFGSTDAVGVFSPMHANGAVKENRDKIYARMYQAAGEKWAKAGASSHSVCLYAHDTIAQEQFFRYGFGMRCVDAIRPMSEIEADSCPEYEFEEVKREEYSLILPLNRMLADHLEKSPSFMKYPSISDAVLLERIMQHDSRFFAARKSGDIIAYIKIAGDGENFACDAPDMQNICGAYCLPQHRGTGVYQNLLNFTIRSLKAEGYTRLGVDFESFNPTAYGFWLKYFTSYTYGVVRRIDEYAAKRAIN